MTSDEQLHCHETPVPYVVVDDFLSDRDCRFVWTMASIYRLRATTGEMLSATGRSVRAARKVNRNLWLTNSDGNPVLEARTFYATLSTKLESLAHRSQLTRQPLYAGLRYVHRWNMLLSIYEQHGDKYGVHRDASWVTASLMLHNPDGRGFEGGDFALGGFGVEEDLDATSRELPEGWVKVPFQNGRLVVFPGLANHCALPIQSSSGSILGGRVSIQCFPSVY